MSYLDALEAELTFAGIPARRRGRIVAEFSDHLGEDPAAELGAPQDLARQFADELGTRLARNTAYRAAALLAIAMVVLVVMFFDGGRTWGAWFGYGSNRVSDYLPGWWVPLMVIWFISTQVAVASAVLAFARAWRLRRVSVITAADAVVLSRRVAVALLSGAVTMLLLPATDLMLARPLTYPGPGGAPSPVLDHWRSLLQSYGTSWWAAVALIGGPLLIVAMLSMLPSVIAATRLRPSAEGAAGDLTADLDPRLVERFRATPERIALALSGALIVVMLAVGIRSDNASAGLLRGIFDAGLCMGTFILLGSYLGLRAAGRTTS